MVAVDVIYSSSFVDICFVVSLGDERFRPLLDFNVDEEASISSVSYSLLIWINRVRGLSALPSPFYVVEHQVRRT